MTADEILITFDMHNDVNCSKITQLIPELTSIEIDIIFECLPELMLATSLSLGS